MKFHWTIEPFGYCLRDSRGYARSVVIRATPEYGGGFYGELFIRDRPLSGPYKGRQEAADWVTSMLVRLGELPPESEFGLIPDTAKSMRAA